MFAHRYFACRYFPSHYFAMQLTVSAAPGGGYRIDVAQQIPAASIEAFQQIPAASIAFQQLTPADTIVEAFQP